MITTITQSQFCLAFAQSSYKDNFSRDGLKALFDHIEQIEQDTGDSIEFDICAIACDYCEFESFEALQQNYPQIESFEDLHDHTIVVCGDEDSQCIVIQAF